MEQPRRPNGEWAPRPGPGEARVPLSVPAEPAALWVDIVTWLRPSLDTSQAADLWERLLTRESEWGVDWAPEQGEKFESWCRSQAGTWPEYRAPLLTLATQAPADAREARALTDVIKSGTRATSALAAQTSMVAGLQQVSIDVAADRIESLRAQYATDLAFLADGERPDPPADWVYGFTSRDFIARQAPSDAATLYAYYRAQADPDVFTDAERTHETFAVVDLETASPQMGAWFKPGNGHIIEVGVVVVDRHGTEVASHEQLVRPPQEFLDAYGTGATHIHHIEVATLDDALSWTEEAPKALDALGAHTLVAQNVDFEKTWLSHHFTAAGLEWDPDQVPVIDTLRLAQQHYSTMDNHRLDTVCAALDVDYTDGHRALHDAQVTARALIAMRDAVHARYHDTPRFQGLAVPY